MQSIFEGVRKSHPAQSPRDCVLPPARAGLGKGREEAEREEAGARGECRVRAGLTLRRTLGRAGQNLPLAGYLSLWRVQAWLGALREDRWSP